MIDSRSIPQGNGTVVGEAIGMEAAKREIKMAKTHSGASDFDSDDPDADETCPNFSGHLGAHLSANLKNTIAEGSKNILTCKSDDPETEKDNEDSESKLHSRNEQLENGKQTDVEQTLSSKLDLEGLLGADEMTMEAITSQSMAKTDQNVVGNENERENEHGNVVLVQNASNKKVVPLVAVACCLIFGSMLMSIITVPLGLNPWTLLGAYTIASLLLLMMLFIFNAIQTSTNAHNCRASQTQKFPHDSYSFVAIFSPRDDPDLFFFGVMVFFFQSALFFLMILSVVSKESRTSGDVDNPDSDLKHHWFAQFIPANAKPIVRATQIIAMLSYMIFPEASLLEITKGIEMFPQFCARNTNGQVWRMTLSCVMRCFQGCLAIFAVFLLVMTSSDVMEIVLNFTAANLISYLDDTAFKIAKAGKYGPVLEQGAKKVESESLPSFSMPKDKYRRYRMTVSVVSCVSFAMVLFVMFSQESNEKWITRTVQVRFETSTGLQNYSGCYDMLVNSHHEKRHSYRLWSDNAELNHTQFGYCKDTRRWVMFNGENLDGAPVDPCSAGENELGYSSKTDLFDISTSFTEPWYSVSNEPLDLFLLDLGEKKKYCSLYQKTGDGVCDDFFNTPEYDLDGGDCCAATCMHPNCGMGGLDSTFAFGTKIISGDGYPDCIDPSMKAVSISLESMIVNDEVSNPLLKLDCDEKTIFSIPLQKSMENKTETVMVAKTANCTLEFESSNHESDSVWEIYYSISDNTNFLHDGNISSQNDGSEYFSVYNLYDDKFFSSYVGEALREETHLMIVSNGFKGTLPSEIGLLTKLSMIVLSANAFTGTLPSEIGLLTQLNIFALFENYFSGALPSEIGMLTQLTELALPLNRFTGTLPSEIGKLTKLAELTLFRNDFSGNLPSELGSLTQLVDLSLMNNAFTGTMPSEIGLMTQLVDLTLSDNALTGTVPSEVGLLTNLNDLFLPTNRFTGSLPTEIGTLNQLTNLHLYYNDLTGNLPSEIGLLTQLTELYLYGNSFTGTLPSEIGLLSQLTELWLAKTAVTGSLPSEIGLLTQLTGLYLYSNIFTGSLPSEIGLLTQLQELLLHSNGFTGFLPNELGLLSELNVLYLSENAFSGGLPLGIRMSSKLTNLDIDDNQRFP